MRELAKTCNFCNDGCAQKNIRDQIIEGLTKGDIVKDLLKEKSLTLETSVSICRAQEAARKQRAEISGVSPRVQAVRQGTLPRPPLSKPQGNQSLCQGCGAAPPRGAPSMPRILYDMPFLQKAGPLDESVPTAEELPAVGHGCPGCCA